MSIKKILVYSGFTAGIYNCLQEPGHSPAND